MGQVEAERKKQTRKKLPAAEERTKEEKREGKTREVSVENVNRIQHRRVWFRHYLTPICILNTRYDFFVLDDTSFLF